MTGVARNRAYGYAIWRQIEHGVWGSLNARQIVQLGRELDRCP
jgi:hypothetical protein